MVGGFSSKQMRDCTIDTYLLKTKRRTKGRFGSGVCGTIGILALCPRRNPSWEKIPFLSFALTYAFTFKYTVLIGWVLLFCLVAPAGLMPR